MNSKKYLKYYKVNNLISVNMALKIPLNGF